MTEEADAVAQLKSELESVERRLAERMGLNYNEGLRAALGDLDKRGYLIEDELVADWHELHASYLAFGAEPDRWSNLEPLACRIHDAVVCSGSDEEQVMAHDWYQQQAIQDPCPACLAIFDILKNVLPDDAQFPKPTWKE